MMYLNHIKKSGQFIEAEVAPAVLKDATFNIKVNIPQHEIVSCSISEDAAEYMIYAKKARNKLCSLAANFILPTEVFPVHMFFKIK